MPSRVWIALLFLGLTQGSAHGLRPGLEGNENIPQLVASSTLVCRGEVVYAPNVITSDVLSRMSTVAQVETDRCYKGQNTGTIEVLFDGVMPPGGTSGGWIPLVLTTGDYDLFFLKKKDGRFAPVDQYYGAIPVSRNKRADESAKDPLSQLEMDFIAGLDDPDEEFVLASIRLLGGLQHLHSLARLHDLLDGGDPVRKIYVWEALLKLRDYSIFPEVMEFFASHPDMPESFSFPRDRLLIVASRIENLIGQIHDPMLEPHLSRLAAFPDVRLRNNALHALRSMNDPRAADVFLRALHDSDPDNGYIAMQGLIELAGGGAPGVPSWEEFRRNPDSHASETQAWWLVSGMASMKARLGASAPN